MSSRRHYQLSLGISPLRVRYFLPNFGYIFKSLFVRFRDEKFECHFAFSGNSNVSKSQEKQASHNNCAELSLKLNRKTHQLYLQTTDKKLGSSLTALLNQNDSQFCSFCNAPQCKLLSDSTASENNDNKPEDNPNIVTILVDKNAFCRAICDEGVSPTPTPQNSLVRTDYCSFCDAPKCKLADKSEHSGAGEQSKISSNEKSVEAAKGSEYCDICKAPKCKLTESLQPKENENKTEQESVTSSKKSVVAENGPDYCYFCDAPTCKLVVANAKQGESSGGNVTVTGAAKGSEYCDICKAPQCKLKEDLANRDENQRLSEKTTEAAKNSEYCDICKAPRCKLSASSNEKGTERPIGSGIDIGKRKLKENVSEDQQNDVDFPSTEKTKRSRSATESSNESRIQNKAIVSEGQQDDIDVASVEKTERSRSPNDINEQKKLNDKTAEQVTDITKLPGYCAACKLPKCKYEASATSKKGKSTEPIDRNSDQIIITVDKTVFCETICKDVTSSEQSKDKITSTTQKKTKPPKSTSSGKFNSNYEEDNSKFN